MPPALGSDSPCLFALLSVLCRQPCPLPQSCAAGVETVRRVKSGSTVLRLGATVRGGGGGGAAAKNYFWRTVLDPATLRCLTDSTAKDYIQDE